MTQKANGKFIVFEGIDEAGKTTQAKGCAEKYGCLYTFEPGGHDSLLKDFVLSSKIEMSPISEALMFAADRAEHVNKVLLPSIFAGVNVICDRYIPSSIAYQGYGRELGAANIETLSLFAANRMPEPDAVIWLDLDYGEHVRRSKLSGKSADRFTDETTKFYSRVIDGYAKQAESRPDIWHRVDAHGTVEEVESVVSDIMSRIGL